MTDLSVFLNLQVGFLFWLNYQELHEQLSRRCTEMCRMFVRVKFPRQDCQ